MVIQTGRFGSLTVTDQEAIVFPQGILGFPELTRFCLVDPGDDTLILWLQSLDQPELMFALLEPKIFRSDYTARLSAAELRELKLDNINHSAVFSILTIPADVTQMTANLKAPLVINLKERVARQVILQENEYSVRHPMFKELRTHILTIEGQRRAAGQTAAAARDAVAVSVKDIPPSLTVKSLQA